MSLSAITHDDVGDDLRRIMISGRLDTPGVAPIAPQLAQLASAPKKGVVVDLCGVNFLASIGIGALITAARTVRNRGGRMVLVIENSNILMSLKTTGVDQLIPVFRSVADAERAALA